MAKPAAFFPGSVLPDLQELATDNDGDNLGIIGSITQKATVILTATYAAAGAVNIVVVGAFGTWPAFGVIENTTTLEQLAYTRTTADTLVVLAVNRGRNGTAPAAGNIGNSIRFIERRGLGRLMAQIQAEIVAHDDILRGSLCKNEAVNGNMAFAGRGASAASTGTPAITAAQAYRLDRFFCRPAGAAVTVQQDTTVPNTDSEFSAQINGAASVTTVNFGQRFEARRAKRLRKKLTFSCYVHNVSGAAFTPKFQLYTPTNANNFAAVNAIALDILLQSCADNAWTKISYTFDPSGITDIAKGFELSIQIPSGSCVAGDTIRVTQFQLERGAAATPFSDAGDLEQQRCERHYEKSYEQATVPGTASASYYFDFHIVSVPNQAKMCTVFFKTRKFTATGTMRVWSFSGTANRAGDNNGTDLAAASCTPHSAGEQQMTVYNNSGGTITPAGSVVLFHWEYDNEL